MQRRLRSDQLQRSVRASLARDRSNSRARLALTGESEFLARFWGPRIRVLPPFDALTHRRAGQFAASITPDGAESVDCRSAGFSRRAIEIIKPFSEHALALAANRVSLFVQYRIAEQVPGAGHLALFIQRTIPAAAVNLAVPVGQASRKNTLLNTQYCQK